MTFKEAIAIFNTWDSKRIKKLLTEIEANAGLKAEVLEYYDDILKYTGGKNLADILKMPKSLATKKVMSKTWSPNVNSIEILNHLTVGYLSLWADDKIPSWIQHTNFETLSLKGYAENELVYPISVSREFELRDCGLTAIPEVIEKIKPKWLGLSENKIKTVPEWVFGVVERLDVNENEIQKIEVKGTYPLTLLRIGKNPISDLTFLKQLPKLDFLFLSETPVSDFPQLENSPLKALYMSNCEFTELPASIDALKKLGVLYLDNNPIEKIPALDLPELKYFDITSTPIGEKNNLSEGFTTEVEVREFVRNNASLNDHATSKNNGSDIFGLLESRDSGKIQEALNAIRANADELQKAEKRYLKFIQARKPEATIFDFEAVMLTPDEAETIGRTIKPGNLTISLGYLDDAECRQLVDFLGSAVESVADIDALKSELSACSTEEALIALGEQKMNEIKNAVADFILEHKTGWVGALLYQFTSSPILQLAFDHTQFDLANLSNRIEGFFVFLQCFGYSDFTIDVFQSDAPKLGEIFWLLPTITKITWFDVEPSYAASPLAFKRSASLSENNQGKRIKSKLLSEVSA